MRKQLVHLTPREDSHAGLLLQRYVSHPADSSERWSQAKRSVLDAARKVEVGALYRIAFDRWSASLPNEPAPIDLTTQGRLIVGLGSESVLETGITLHHTYGVPIIPGSALKGLSAHYCHEVWGSTDEKFRRDGGAFHQLLFGTTDDSGCITFHDSWLTPDSPRPLTLDVMTPHHPKWLDGSVPPSDFDSPTPVPFLSVTGSFRVAVSWHGPSSDRARDWTKLARSLLCDALKEWGIGGKTTSGYGRLVDPATLADSSPSDISKGKAHAPPVPKYQRGDSIQVTREQIKGKVKFRADDGFLGHFVAPESPPNDDAPTVWVANVGSQGYTFTMKRPEVKDKSLKKSRKENRK